MQALEIVGVAVGAVYLWLEYRASRWLWVVSVIMPAIYLVVFYGAGLYADTAINIYYLAVALYGWGAWGKKGEGKTLPITRTSARTWSAMVALYIAGQLIFTALLMHCTDSDIPLANGATAALSVVAMWMLARKKIEQWIVWIVVDILSAALYAYKGLHLTAVLYAIYAVVAVAGYLKWKRLMNTQYAEQ